MILRIKPGLGGRFAQHFGHIQKKMEFMYAPSSVKVSKTATWDDATEAGSEGGESNYKKGSPREVSMQLFVNDYGQGQKASSNADVSHDLILASAKIKQRVNEIWYASSERGFEGVVAPYNLVEKSVDWLEKAMRPKGGTPPILELIWARGQAFDCVLLKMDVTYGMFDPQNWIPVRATIDIALREYIQGSEERGWWASLWD